MKILIYFILGICFRVNAQDWEIFKLRIRKIFSYFGFFKIYKEDLENKLIDLTNKYNNILLIDIGANYGQTINLFLDLGISIKSYLAFEPNPSPFYYLRKKIPKIKLLKNINIFNVAIGNETLVTNFFVPYIGNLELSGLVTSKKNTIRKCLIINFLPKKISNLFLDQILLIKNRIFEIKEMTSFIKFANYQESDAIFLKIDVQGAEKNVLESFFKLNIANKDIIILIEVELDFDNSIASFLFNNGYKCLESNDKDQLWLKESFK